DRRARPFNQGCRCNMRGSGDRPRSAPHPLRATEAQTATVMRGQARARVIDEQRDNRWRLACGVIGPPLFVIVFLIEEATRPGYSAWRHYVSQLSLGEGGWMQIANFLVCGLLSLCFALGLRRTLQGGTGATWG